MPATNEGHRIAALCASTFAQSIQVVQRVVCYLQKFHSTSMPVSFQGLYSTVGSEAHMGMGTHSVAMCAPKFQDICEKFKDISG